MNKLLTTIIVAFSLVSNSHAAERKPISDVVIDEFVRDSQVSFVDTGDFHFAIAWWVPNEYWESILSRNTAGSEPETKAMLSAVSGISLLAVVQADISALGSFNFYSRTEIEDNLKVYYSSPDSRRVSLKPMQDIDSDLDLVLRSMTPILAAGMGNLGENMHFYVLNDETDSDLRLIDPYLKGVIDIQLTKKDKAILSKSLDLPLNSLFIPRKCPNGKDAHISWVYCPWSGEKL